MRVKCVICDVIESIPDFSPQAKKLRNRPIHTYLCQACYNRIEQKTNNRMETGNFRLYRAKKQDDEW
ncbi:YlaI family protein [Peribacillus sp. SCS-155]|uniref:YlaI family protein n=1 Tax=Peribacillus sedimenti TaxID=3115297 RepID=UPI0039065E0C